MNHGLFRAGCGQCMPAFSSIDPTRSDHLAYRPTGDYISTVQSNRVASYQAVVDRCRGAPIVRLRLKMAVTLQRSYIVSKAFSSMCRVCFTVNLRFLSSADRKKCEMFYDIETYFGVRVSFLLIRPRLCNERLSRLLSDMIPRGCTHGHIVYLMTYSTTFTAQTIIYLDTFYVLNVFL